ncbi:unnamed protein product [Chrysoparadoxa australica]
MVSLTTMMASDGESGDGNDAEGGAADGNAEGEGEEAPKQPNFDYDGGMPVSFRSDNGTRDSEFYMDGIEKGTLNPYFDVVRRLSPSELIGRFMRTSSPRVQEAVRTTVLGLLGSLPRHAFETTAISSGDALANLMFQLQMTGYMFKNAEYRLSLATSLQQPLLALSPAEDDTEGNAHTAAMIENGVEIPKPQISGTVKLSYESGQQVEVDAEAYMAELTTQVSKLENELSAMVQQQRDKVEGDLLTYVKNMPPNQLAKLTQGVSPEVLESMRMLVETVMRSMGGGEISATTITQQTGQGMSQLVMWQLVVGYNLREMEAREELRKRASE